MLGNLAEKKAYDEAMGNKPGRISNRYQANAVIEEAKRDMKELTDLEQARTRKRRSAKK